MGASTEVTSGKEYEPVGVVEALRSGGEVMHGERASRDDGRGGAVGER